MWLSVAAGVSLGRVLNIFWFCCFVDVGDILNI